MEAKSPVQKIDIALQYLKDNPTRINFDSFNAKLNELGLTSSQYHTRTLLDKLKHDRLVMDLPGPSNREEGLLITYEGLLFEGYQAKFLNDSAAAEQRRLELERLRTVDSNSERNQIRLNDLTLYLSIGTGVLALIEFVKFVVWIFSSQKSL